jgi:hypothetical protein
MYRPHVFRRKARDQCRPVGTNDHFAHRDDQNGDQEEPQGLDKPKHGEPIM